MALADQVLINIPPVELARILLEAKSLKTIPIGGGVAVVINFCLQLVKYFRQFDESEGGGLVFFRRDSRPLQRP